MGSLTKKDIDYFRDRLEQRKLSLADVAKTGEQSAETVALDQAKVGRLSRIDALQVQAMSQETNRWRGIELSRIAAAIGRLDKESYGIYASCDDDIARQRLELDPATPVCVDCASKADR